MNFNRYILHLAIITFFVSSCQKDIDISFSSFQSRLVVNSTFNADSVFTVHVSKTGNIADKAENIEMIEYASVFLSFSDTIENKKILTHVGNGKYIASNYYPVPGQEYFLEVRAAGFDIATAHNKIPTVATILEVDTTSIQSAQGTTALQIDFTIDNSDFQANYLIYDVVQEYEDSNVNGILDYFQAENWFENAWLSSLTSDTEKITKGEGLQSKIFMEDSDVSSPSIVASIVSYEDFSQSEVGATTSQNDIYLRVMAVSKELYEYSKSMEYYKLNRNTNSNHSQPLELYSNVEGGLGVFGGYSQTLIEL